MVAHHCSIYIYIYHWCFNIFQTLRALRLLDLPVARCLQFLLQGSTTQNAIHKGIQLGKTHGAAMHLHHGPVQIRFDTFWVVKWVDYGRLVEVKWTIFHHFSIFVRTSRFQVQCFGWIALSKSQHYLQCGSNLSVVTQVAPKNCQDLNGLFSCPAADSWHRIRNFSSNMTGILFSTKVTNSWVWIRWPQWHPP